jgi:hypothetical protein
MVSVKWPKLSEQSVVHVGLSGVRVSVGAVNM